MADYNTYPIGITVMITSSRNPKIQAICALQSRAKRRREEGAFVVEGVRLVEEALAAGWPMQQLLYSAELHPRGLELVAHLQRGGVPTEEVSPEVMIAASDTPSPQGILLVLDAGELDLPAALDLILILDAIRDPGNLGTLLRSAVAAGAGAVMLGPGSVDAFAPKVLRAAMGAHFRLPIRQWDWPAIAKLVGEHGLAVYLAETGATLPYDQADLTKPLGFLIGGEAEGAGQAARDLAHDGVFIPMPGEAESLNAAVAGSVLLFEAARQRRAQGAT